MRLIFTIAFLTLPLAAHAGDSDPIFGGAASGTFQVVEQAAELNGINFNQLFECKQVFCPAYAANIEVSNFEQLASARP